MQVRRPRGTSNREHSRGAAKQNNAPEKRNTRPLKICALHVQRVYMILSLLVIYTTLAT